MWVERKGRNCKEFADPAGAHEATGGSALCMQSCGEGGRGETSHCWSDWSDKRQVCPLWVINRLTGHIFANSSLK